MPRPVALVSAMMSGRMLMVLLPSPVAPPMKLPTKGAKRLATPLPERHRGYHPDQEGTATGKIGDVSGIEDQRLSGVRIEGDDRTAGLHANRADRAQIEVFHRRRAGVANNLNSPPCIEMFRTKPEPMAKLVPPRRSLRLVTLLSRMNVPPSGRV